MSDLDDMADAGGDMRLKICCVQDEWERDLAVSVGAHLIGFVGRGCSGPEVIEDDRRIGELAAGVPAGATATLLVRGTEPDEIIERARLARAGVLQLLDPLSGSAYGQIRAAIPGVRLLNVVHVQGPEAIHHAREMAQLGDAVLLDSGSPAEGVFGGTGQTHDWNVSAQIVRELSVPVWLAGGLNAENLQQAWEQVKPAGVDICSGFRTDGRMDPAKVRAVVGILRSLPL